MKYCLLPIIIALFSCSAFAETDPSLKFIFSGIEVTGFSTDIADRIRNLSLIKPGDIMTLSEKKYYCDQLIQKFTQENLVDGNLNCSGVVYSNKESINTLYLIIEYDPEDKNKSWFRNDFLKEGESAKLPVELDTLYKQLDDRADVFFNAQKPTHEHRSGDFLDYEDPIMHEIAVQLNMHAAKHHMRLLEIIRDSNDPDERLKAANLLSWSGNHDKTLETAIAWNLLYDPDNRVRNALARSIAIFIDNVNNETVLKQSLTYYCLLAKLPIFTDRNKSISTILYMLQKNPELAAQIQPECKQTIHEIADQSILINVGGHAKEVLRILDQNSGA